MRHIIIIDHETHDHVSATMVCQRVGDVPDSPILEPTSDLMLALLHRPEALKGFSASGKEGTLRNACSRACEIEHNSPHEPVLKCKNVHATSSIGQKELMPSLLLQDNCNPYEMTPAFDQLAP